MATNMKNIGMNITVDDGSRRVPITNMDGEEIGAFRFHPTDIGIVERFNRMAEKFDAIAEPLGVLDTVEELDLTDPKLREGLAEAEKRMNAAVNELFGSEDAAEAFFGKMHPFSPVNGEFYATQVLQKVGQFIGAQFNAETKAMSKKARKYLK